MRSQPRWLLARALVVAALVGASATEAFPLQQNWICPAEIQKNISGLNPNQSLKLTIFTKADGNCVLNLHCVSTIGVRLVGASIQDFEACWIEHDTQLRHCSSGGPPVLYVEFTLDAACGQTDSEEFYIYNATGGQTGSCAVTLYCDPCG